MPGWLGRLIGAARNPRAGAAIDSRVIGGIRVDVANTREDVDTERVFARAAAVLSRVRRYQPARYAHLQRDIAGILVKRFPCRGAYFSDTGMCLLELTFMANDSFSDSQVAASLVHEGMHARLDRLVERFGIRSYSADPARHERICRRAELHFGAAVPDGGPVIERATETLSMQDDEVAPAIDWAEAQHNVEAADHRAKRD
jgi:hypothetical protein